LIDAADSITDIIYRLGFQNSTDLDATGTWVTSTELYQFADEACQRLAFLTGAFITYDTSITVTSGTALYNLPASNVFTLAAWLGSNALRITPVRELFALDAAWSATTGPAARASLDAGGVGTITLYPNPTAGGTLNQLAEEYPATVALGSSTVPLPVPLQDWLSYEILAAARRKESDAWQPDMADHFDQRSATYREIIQHLYGVGA
jgi:hypothetical protein